jgi:hypothetical protein
MTVTRLPSHSWRVRWWDFDGRHDWVGKYQGRRKPLPPIEHTRNFYSRDAAEKFAASLRSEGDAADLVVQITSQLNTLRPRPQQPLLPGDWPRQQRHDKET